MKSEIRKKLIDAFQKANGGYVSGQVLAKAIGCSRTAVWKHIEDLRKEGFKLEAVQKKGYRLIHTPSVLTEEEILLGLETEKIGRSIFMYDSIPSTQKIAQELAPTVEEGTIVIAEEQTLGRGRLDRQWYSPKGTGVWMTLVIKPNIPIQQAPQLTLLTAVAVVQAIEAISGLLPTIKWPNDILLNGKKVCGILTEMEADSDRIQNIFIGTGVNVNEKNFPNELRNKATSIAIETNKEMNRAEYIQQYCLAFEKLYHLYLQQGFKPIKILWESYSNSIGKSIVARTINKEFYGVAEGITDDGVLMLREQNGTIRYIYSADIEFSNEQ